MDVSGEGRELGRMKVSGVKSGVLDVIDKRGKGYLCVCVNSFVSYLCVTTLPVNTTPQIHQTSNISF